MFIFVVVRFKRLGESNVTGVTRHIDVAYKYAQFPKIPSSTQSQTTHMRFVFQEINKFIINNY